MNRRFSGKTFFGLLVVGAAVNYDFDVCKNIYAEKSSCRNRGAIITCILCGGVLYAAKGGGGCAHEVAARLASIAGDRADHDRRQ